MLYILIVITIIRKKEDIYLVRIINEFNFRLVSFFFLKNYVDVLTILQIKTILCHIGL